MLRRLRGSSDSGFTLVESLTTFILLGIVGAMMATGITAGLRTTSTVEDQVRATAKLRTAVERLARELRTADPVELGTAGPQRLQVRIVRNGVCQRIAYRLVGSSLMQYVQGPLSPAPAPVGGRTVSGACTSPAATEPPPAGLPATVLAPQLATTTAVFTYFDSAGTVMPFGSGGPSLSEKNIARIRITLRRELTGRKPILVTTEVQLRNGDANRAVDGT